MNKNSLTTAVIAGLAGVAVIANMANAVNLNPDGLGQVLLYPYYTVNGGQNTLLSVVNTTNVGKAVKVASSKAITAAKCSTSTSSSRRSTSGPRACSRRPRHRCRCDHHAGQQLHGSAVQAGPLANGAGYQSFLNFGYIGTNEDTGPTGLIVRAKVTSK